MDIHAAYQNGHGCPSTRRKNGSTLCCGTKKATSNAGQETFTMHACGHDVHMTVFVGTARALSQSKDRWRGTLVMIGQPAEENGLGADAMLKAGLYERFPKPDYAIALHDNPTLPAEHYRIQRRRTHG